MQPPFFYRSSYPEFGILVLVIWPWPAYLPFSPTASLNEPFSPVKPVGPPASKHTVLPSRIPSAWIVIFLIYSDLSRFSSELTTGMAIFLFHFYSICWGLMVNNYTQFLTTSHLPLLCTVYWYALVPSDLNCKRPKAGSKPKSHVHAPQLLGWYLGALVWVMFAVSQS